MEGKAKNFINTADNFPGLISQNKQTKRGKQSGEKVTKLRSC